jgi:uncharacterized protein
MNPTPRLVLFARYPTPGAAKTRLIPALSAEGAAELHRRLTERTLQILRSSSLPIEFYFTGADKTAFRELFGDGFVLVEQVEGDLTDRLMAALDPAPVIFFGADTPDLEERHVVSAVAGLREHDIVLGPAKDGGYYLIGMNRACPALLTNMPWSTDQVLPETLRRLTAMGIQPALLELLHDCDRPEDLVRWPWLTAQ